MMLRIKCLFQVYHPVFLEENEVQVTVISRLEFRNWDEVGHFGIDGSIERF